MYILSVEGVTILPVETAEEIAEWLLNRELTENQVFQHQDFFIGEF